MSTHTTSPDSQTVNAPCGQGGAGVPHASPKFRTLCWHRGSDARQHVNAPAGPAVPRAARVGCLLLRAADRRIALHPNRLDRLATRALLTPSLTQARSATTPEQTCGATIVAAATRPASIASILASASALPAASAAFAAFDASPTFASAVSAVVPGTLVVGVVVAAAVADADVTTTTIADATTSATCLC